MHLRLIGRLTFSRCKTSQDTRNTVLLAMHYVHRYIVTREASCVQRLHSTACIPSIDLRCRSERLLMARPSLAW